MLKKRARRSSIKTVRHRKIKIRASLPKMSASSKVAARIPHIGLKPKYKKSKIPAALREQVWMHNVGPKFKTKCFVSWCKNNINVFDFQCGHIHAESNGGITHLSNLIPLCCRCNLSMGTMHLDEWERLGAKTNKLNVFNRFMNWIRCF